VPFIETDAIRRGNVIGSSTMRVVSWRDGAAHDATAIAASATNLFPRTKASYAVWLREAVRVATRASSCDGSRMVQMLVGLFVAAIAPKSGPALCALTPADFQAAGVTGAAKPKANVQDAGAGAYCVYAGKSGATGGIELDVFYPAGANATEVQATYVTAIGEGGDPLKPIKLDGADEARWAPAAVSGGPPFATIAVRRGQLVFLLSFPSGKNAQAQLTKLAAIVLKRF
jgi:hypothetical protein